MYVRVWDDVDADRWGDEYRVWEVAVCDDDGDPLGKVYRYRNENAALNLAWKMGRDRDLEVVQD